MLLAMRLLQGIASGAATVVAPTVIRATLPEKDGVRGIAAIAMVEAVVPAAGPVAGAALLVFTDWRGAFWAIALLTLLALPFALRASPAQLPGQDAVTAVGYRHLVRDMRYVRVALCHALGFGALITFVASAPQALRQAFEAGPGGFALAQALGVGTFILLASQAGRISDRIGAPRAVQVGAWLHVVLCAAFLAATALGAVGFGWTLVFWSATGGSIPREQGNARCRRRHDGTDPRQRRAGDAISPACGGTSCLPAQAVESARDRPR